MKYFCGAKNLGGRLSAWGTDLLRACCQPPAATIPPAAGNIDFRTFGVGHRPQAVHTRNSPDDTPMSDTQWRSRLPLPMSVVSLNPVGHLSPDGGGVGANRAGFWISCRERGPSRP